jgi:hypothetical protein
MKRDDRELEMDRPFTRREFLNGVGVVAASSVLPGAGTRRTRTRARTIR